MVGRGLALVLLEDWSQPAAKVAIRKVMARAEFFIASYSTSIENIFQ
jgi:hypothetical protein